MLSKEDNDILTQTDRGTPMGELFRRFWVPVLLSEEIPLPDGPPVRFRVLGEDLLAFRDTEGRPGVVDTHCPHRGAPLYFGRNEENGIRCLYHGWKFDVAGSCMDMPNIPNGDVMKSHMRLIAYPVVEAAGMVWAYMGPADRQPPLPAYPFFGLEAERTYVTKYELNCNWYQAQEGDFDSTHAQFVHSAWDSVETVHAKGDLMPRTLPSFDTPIGQMVVFSRHLGDGTMQLSAQHIVFPSTLPPGTGSGNGVLAANIRVPIDDEHEWHFRLRYAIQRPLTPRELLEFKVNGFAYAEHESGTWRTKGNKDNDYLQDRILQRQFNFSGFSAFQLQDASMLEDQWGPICDRTKEHLVAPDIAIVLQRNRLLTMAKNLAAGREPEDPFLLAARTIVQQLPEPLAPVPAADAMDNETIEQIARGMDTARVPDYAQAFDSNSLSEYSNRTWDQVAES
jgi:phenylpropionate dioxygenase-like ring-hydroxylating dioxygenase large terminal subunit